MKKKSLKTIRDGIADHVGIAKRTRMAISDVLVSLEMSNYSVEQMWTTLAVVDPFSDETIQMALDKFCPNVKKHADALTKLVVLVKK